MKERKDFLVNIAYYGVIFAIAWLIFKYVLPSALPFLLGYCVAILVCKVTSKCKRKKKLVQILATIVFYLVVGGLFSLGFLEIFSSLYSSVMKLPTLYEEEIVPVTKIVYNNVTLFISTVIMIIASFFFVIDYDRVSDFFNNRAPQ